MGQQKNAIVGRAARFTTLAALSIGFASVTSTTPSPGDRPGFVAEAKAALMSEALSLEAEALWRDRPLSPMAERGGRVVAERKAPTEGRVALRLNEGGSLLRAGIVGGDDLMRTALAGPQDFTSRMSLAKAFVSPAQRMDPAEQTVMASLALPSGPGASADDAEMAYAPSGAPSVSSRFTDILRDRQPGKGFVPPIGAKDHSWAATPLPAAAFSKKEQTCLATGIYFEARGEVARGQEAVAQVILNRVRAPSYPDTICGVVYQNKHMRNRCQFSFACDGIPDRITNKRAYAKAERIALAVTRGEIWLPEVGSATHYHATYVAPRWARAMEKMEKIGLHVFYRTFNGGWN
ncbi:cell wall hydrolase [Aureimonas populi]|uniref:Cell wall hydrolase n=1 Tax=Aureimonas populi TaxID=1701758 RepID=A0ABW5CKA2_9HYPH|nr:cell wall hydrolase [Aureimonas populi]